MPLIDFWTSNPESVDKLNIQQIVATAGDGDLKDDSDCSKELREYFLRIASEKLAEYIEYCLTNSFPKSGFVLQDLVNEFGRRLEYEVRNGRYQGRASALGHDGEWLSTEGDAIVVEVKTTDVYRISLDTIVRYRDGLIAKSPGASDVSILIVVGREDTGELEAQVRGSRHAWDIRLISAEALIKLVQIKENADGFDTGRKFRSLLRPMEYTRLDAMADVMFTATKEVEAAADANMISEDGGDPEIGEPAKAPEKGKWQFTDSLLIQKKRDAILAALAQRERTSFVRRTRAVYWNTDRTIRVVCTISKRYERSPSYRYWYAYHPRWNEFLSEGERSFFVLGCMDLNVGFAIPADVMRSILDDLNTTGDTNEGGLWHIHIAESIPGEFSILLSRRQAALPLIEYQFPLGEKL